MLRAWAIQLLKQLLIKFADPVLLEHLLDECQE